MWAAGRENAMNRTHPGMQSVSETTHCLATTQLMGDNGRVISGTRRAVVTTLTTAAVTATAGCTGLSGGVESIEVARQIGGKGRVEAVVVQTNAGATTTYSYAIHLVPAGEPIGAPAMVTITGAQRSRTAYGVNLEWTDARTVVVNYWKADSIHPENAQLRHAHLAGMNLRVVLESAPPDHHAPPGPMPPRH